MKKILTLILSVLSLTGANATTFMITVSNFQFSPSNIPNVFVGDIIQFNFSSLNNHNSTSLSLGLVPAGAADIYSGSPGSVTTSYSYTVTVAGNYRYYCENHSFDGVTGMVGTFTASNPVPVKLSNFSVAYANKAVTAIWQTVTEQNVSRFLLLKSTDGINYTEAGQVRATGNSNTLQTYRFKDEDPGMYSRYIYYMLKTIDNDGKYSLSDVRLVRNTGSAIKIITEIGPNPVNRETGHLMFRFNADRNTFLKALVHDAGGKTMMNLELTAYKGINNGHIHMADLPVGVYTILFSLDGLKEIYKIMLK